MTVIVVVLASVGAVAAGASSVAFQGGDATPGHEPRKPSVASTQVLAQGKAFEIKAEAEAAGPVVIRGVVLDPVGRPQQSASVYFWVGDKVGEAVPTPQAITDREGRFRFKVVRPVGGYWKQVPIVASATGFGPDWTLLDDLKLDNEVNLKLVEDVPITGRILDLQGKTVPGAKVRVERIAATAAGDLSPYLRALQRAEGLEASLLSNNLHEHTAGVWPERVKTGDDGRFRISGAGRERVVRLEVTGRELEETAIDVLTRPGLTAEAINGIGPAMAMREGKVVRSGYAQFGPNFDLIVRRGRAVSGRVRERGTGKPVSGASVCYFGAERSGGNVVAGSDSLGRFHLEGLPTAAPVRLLVFPPSDGLYLPVAMTIAAAEHEPSPKVEIELATGVTVRGRIVERATGRPVGSPDASVLYSPLAGNSFYRNSPSGDWFKGNGNTYSVAADGTFKLVVGPGPGVILVQIQDGHARINTRYLPSRRSPDAGANPPASADETLAGLDDEDIFLPLYQGYYEIDPKPRLDPPPCEIRLELAQTCGGKVVGPDGKPVAGALVAGLWSGVRHARFPPRELDGANFIAEGLDRIHPRYLLAAHAARKLAGFCTVSGSAESPVFLKLQAWGTIRGRLLDPDGGPLSGAQISVSYSSARGKVISSDSVLPEREPFTTDRNGDFQVDGVIPNLAASLILRENGKAVSTGDGLKKLALKPGEARDLGEVRARSPK